jgi:signal-transduction protein with cAMP-binding, CBS, and nucleotidyltransferase domain
MMRGRQTVPHSLAIVHKGIRECLTAPSLIVTRTEPISVVLQRFADKEAPVAIVIDAGRRPIGVLTPGDVVRRSAWRLAPETPVERVMSPPTLVIADSETAIAALAQMRRRRLPFAPVTAADGTLAGLISATELAFGLAGPTAAQLGALALAETVEALRETKLAQIDIVEGLLAERADAPAVQALISDINGDIHARVTHLATLDLERDGWGTPPVPFAVIVMGSAGRRESLLDPDQDNGIIIGDYADGDHAAIEPYFAELALRLNRLLDQAGFALCKGNVMAWNPVWRKRAKEWVAQVAHWLKRRADYHLLQADVLYDFRCVAGDESLAAELRNRITEAAKGNLAFIKDLYRIESDHRVALGWFGRLTKEADLDDRPGHINLKMRGSLPLVEGARLMALKAGVAETSTIDRLARLNALGLLTAEDEDYLTGAFALIGRLLLLQQIRERRAGLPVTDYVSEASLTRRERDHLVDCFRAIESMRSSLRSDLGGPGFM